MGKIIMLDNQCGNYNRSYLSNVTILVKNSRMFLDFNLIKALVPGVKMDMEFLISLGSAIKSQKIFQYTLDMCSMLAQKRNNMFKRWFATFFNAGNFRKYCPVDPNYYYLKNYNYNTLFIPKFLSAGRYRVNFEMHQFKDFVLFCTFEVEIK
ncbi:hypothetical protein KR009_011613 [Drosophila setifemur]|nr:hypothetical protein KR009_011613 [Drosophila setifemur]